METVRSSEPLITTHNGVIIQETTTQIYYGIFKVLYWKLAAKLDGEFMNHPVYRLKRNPTTVKWTSWQVGTEWDNKQYTDRKQDVGTQEVFVCDKCRTSDITAETAVVPNASSASVAATL
jgi:hypothetical protein